MRVFLNWVEKGGTHPDLVRMMLEFKNHGHEIVYWIGHPGAEGDKHPETVFHSYVDAMNGLPAKGLHRSEFEPVGEDFINKFCKEESIILTMMNRLFDKLCVDERRSLYYSMLRYWNGVLNKYRPEVIIFPSFPHMVCDYIIYILARLLNIKIIAFDDTRIPGHLLCLNDFRVGSEVFKRVLADNEGKNFTVDDLSGNVKEYYLSRSSQDYKAPPSYVQDQKKKLSTIHWLLTEPKIRESVKNLTIFRKFFVYLYRMFKDKGLSAFNKPLKHLSYIFKDNLKKEYRRLETKPDLSKNFIYAPLQVQPERTTSPQGDVFADQILMLEILSASLPEGWEIYVKEHPIQWLRFGLGFFSARYRGYYKRIAEIKHVRLVPVETNSYSLIDASQAVAAVTGSANWEAVLKSKPAITFGYVWYQDCPGILRANNVATCREAIEKIKQGYKVDQQKIINYLKSFEQATIRGFLSNTAGKGSKLSKEECMKNITEFLIGELAK